MRNQPVEVKRARQDSRGSKRIWELKTHNLTRVLSEIEALHPLWPRELPNVTDRSSESRRLNTLTNRLWGRLTFPKVGNSKIRLLRRLRSNLEAWAVIVKKRVISWSKWTKASNKRVVLAGPSVLRDPPRREVRNRINTTLISWRSRVRLDLLSSPTTARPKISYS